MRDYITIGSAPAEEPCVQVSSTEAYSEPMWKECRRFLRLIREKLGAEPGTARLSVKGFPHDFGTYYEVVCSYDDNDEIGMEYAYKCEAESPANW